VRVNIDLSQVVNHLLSSSKVVVSLRIILSIEVLLGITISIVKDIIHIGLLTLKVVVVNVKLA
jgi:hypothetical protein